MGATTAKSVFILTIAGLVVGFIVLGMGGRILMRLLAFITPEPARVSLCGTTDSGAGAVWVCVTAPLLMVLGRWRPRFRRAFGSVFGLVVLSLALVLFVLYSGLDGGIVAPPLLIVGTVVLFPLLFMVHGLVLESITRKRDGPWRDREGRKATH